MSSHKMIESRGIFFIRFDGGRIGWFIADTHCVFCIWSVKLIIEACLLFLIFSFTGITPIELSLMIQNFLGQWLNPRWQAVLSILWPLLFAVMYVFMLRRNPTVKLAQRALPYTRYSWI